MSGRHLDSTARMIWLTLRREGPCSEDSLLAYWRPTFTQAEIADALQRLEANEMADLGPCGWSIGKVAMPAVEPVGGIAA